MKKWWILLISISLFVRVSYINNGFTFLDHGDIEGKRAVLPINRLGEALTSRFGETGFFRPAVTIFHSLDNFIYGDNAAGYHLTNILIHLAVTIAAVYFFRLFFNLKGIESFVAAIIFSLHPINFLVVGSISLRNESLVVLFTLLTLIFYIKGKLFPSGIFFMLALFSKETAIFWVPILL